MKKLYISGEKTDKNIQHAANIANELGFKLVYYKYNSSLYDRIETMLSCDSLLLLDGWINDRNSRIEKMVADEFDMLVLPQSNLISDDLLITRIKDAIYKATGYKFEQYVIMDTKKALFFPRVIFIYLVCEHIDKETAALYTNRDITTIKYSLKIYNNDMITNEKFREMAEKALFYYSES